MTARGDRRRTALLRAATHIFLQHGFEAASLDEIIRQAGGSRSMIYEQFGGKEGLFAAIIADLCESITTPLAEAIANQRSPASVLTSFADLFMARLMDPASLALYRVVIAESRRFPKLGAQVFAAGPEAAAGQLAAYLSRETRKGTLRIRQPAMAARLFLEMIKGDLHTRALFGVGRPPSRPTIQRCVRAAVAAFLHGATVKRAVLNVRTRRP
jgi:AcrR family transcriptional regulator